MSSHPAGDPATSTSTGGGPAATEGTVRVLDVHECLDLLQGNDFGRVGFTTDAGPCIYPVNYVMAAGAIVIRTSPYSSLFVNSKGLVAFEIDEIDRSTHSGWSVLAVGHCAQVDDPDEAIGLRKAGTVEPWASGHRNVFVRITPTEITGRRIG